MKETEKNLGRRQFLAGAATVVGAAAVGIAPAIAQAQTRPVIDRTTLHILYWNGADFVLPTTLESGLTDHAVARVTLRGNGSSAHFQSVDAVFGGNTFKALSSAPYGVQSVGFTAPVGAMGSLQLTVWGAGRTVQRFSLRTGLQKGDKLVMGTYVILELGIAPEALLLTAEGKVIYRDGQAFDHPHIVISVDEA